MVSVDDQPGYSMISLQTRMVLAATLLIGGCARDRYRYGLDRRAVPPSAPQTGPIAVGGVHPRVDRVERVVQAPRQWIRKVRGQPAMIDDQPGREAAVQSAARFLAVNGLEDVCIDVRRYEPAEQWSRLLANDRIAPAWKYTGGVLNWVGYTLLPGRAFHRDNYSPYTNTLSINSTRPSSALYESAEAKQYARQEWLGTYAMAQRLPLVPLWHHGQSSTDVLTYAKAIDDWDLQQELYVRTYSRMGAAAVSEAMILLPSISDGPFYEGMAVQIAGSVSGATTGKMMARREESKRRASNHR